MGVGQHSSHETSSVYAVAPSALLQLHESHALFDHRPISRSRSLLRAEPRSCPKVLAWERYIICSCRTDVHLCTGSCTTLKSSKRSSSIAKYVDLPAAGTRKNTKKKREDRDAKKGKGRGMYELDGRGRSRIKTKQDGGGGRRYKCECKAAKANRDSCRE